MTRNCAISGMAPREGEHMMPLRIQPEDVKALQEALGMDREIEPAMYHAISETIEAYRIIVAARLGLEVNEVRNEMMT